MSPSQLPVPKEGKLISLQLMGTPKGQNMKTEQRKTKYSGIKVAVFHVFIHIAFVCGSVIMCDSFLW